MVRGYDTELKIQLPSAYTRSIMPDHRLHIPNAEMARRWEHLEGISKKLMPVNDCDFGLKRLKKDTRYRNDYLKGMNDLIAKGYAEKVDSVQSSSTGNIPHHQKPEKAERILDLRRLQRDYGSVFGLEAANFIRKDFQVDDGLTLVAGVDDAVRSVKASQQMCSNGGLRLHKFRSYSNAVIKQIPPDDRANDIKKHRLLEGRTSDNQNP
ncbi:unnamed protein product [Mytilus coruscus]|uniref:Uncharacterized protein n=1 Tax=Mytilus coruscus TaxID=42192 RepID=A0A6J8AA78_MYTCO|nr:unnamed protein product [Mytilus coruscus]